MGRAQDSAGCHCADGGKHPGYRMKDVCNWRFAQSPASVVLATIANKLSKKYFSYIFNSIMRIFYVPYSLFL